jgi:sugar phosphate isomerase/epimerase
MRWGCCGDLDRLGAIDRAGYDFIESPVRVVCPDQPSEAAEPYRSAVRSSRLPAEAFNVFLPGTLPIIGPEVDDKALKVHVSTIVDRVADLGAQIIVLGSGGARKIPEDWDPDAARQQFLAFCSVAAEIVAASGITIVIEPLSRSACNYIHTVAEAQTLAAETARPEISTLADLYHMQMNDDAISSLSALAGDLKHVHLPVPNLPGLIKHERDFDHRSYLSTLKGAGYSGRISVEDNGKRFGDFEKEAQPVLEHLKNIWESV